MIRRIITIDKEKCTGCALCVNACHEGAIGLRDGKAVLLREDYCDGLGDCLPACPADAIHFEEREAAAYDHEAVQKHLAARKRAVTGGCPGSAAAFFGHGHEEQTPIADKVSSASAPAIASQLSQWPVQIKLVAPNAPYLMAVICSLQQTAQLMLTAIFIRNSSKTTSPSLAALNWILLTTAKSWHKFLLTMILRALH